MSYVHLIFQTKMLKHSFQSNTLRSRGEGESEDSSGSSSEEEQVEFNRRQKIKLKEEKVKAELEAELARDIWHQQTASKEVVPDLDSDRWKGFGSDLSKMEKDKFGGEKEERELREQHLCLGLLGLLLVFCLILYGILLHFILQAATC